MEPSSDYTGGDKEWLKQPACHFQQMQTFFSKSLFLHYHKTAHVMGGRMMQHWDVLWCSLTPWSAKDVLGDPQSPDALAAHQHNKVGANTSFQEKYA